MSNGHYERVIQEWCQTTGLPPWQPENDMHVEVDGTVVGLIYDAAADKDFLNVYYDLGHMDFPDMYQTLLEENAALESLANGCFGILPESGSVVFRARIPLCPSIHGATLPERLGEILGLVRQRLHA